MHDAPHNPYLPPPLPQEEARTGGHSIAPLKNPTIHSWLAIASIILTTIFIIVHYMNDMMEATFGESQIPQPRIHGHSFNFAGPALVLAIIAVCMWIYRCAWNARQLAGPAGSSSPGWCVGCYFVPVVNLFVPYLCMREIAENTFPRTPDPVVKHSLLPWWLCCLYFNFVGKEDRPDVWNLSALVSLVGATVLFSLIIHRITKAQVALSKRDPAEFQTPPPRTHGTPPPHTTLPGYQKSPR